MQNKILVGKYIKLNLLFSLFNIPKLADMKKLLIALLSLVILACLWLGYMGVFNKVEVQTGQEGGYELSGIFHHGSYANISETFEEMVGIADSNGFDVYNMVSIYFNNPNQVPEDSLMTFVGVVLRDSTEIEALTKEGLTRITLPEGDAVYSDFKYRNKMSYAIGPIVNYPELFEVSTEKGWDPVIGFEFFRRDYTRYVLLNGDINDLR